MPSLTQEQAREALADIELVSRQTRRAVAQGPLGNNLVIWGAIWVLAFALSWLSPRNTGRIWMVLAGPGLVASGILALREHRRGKVQSERAQKLHGQIALFWLAVIAYALALGCLLPLQRGADQLALMVTVLMLGYVLLGIWVRSGVLCGIGLVVAAAALAGRAFLDPRGFLLWMAVFGGGGLFLPGLLVKLRWR